jgi:hypothetical protein
MCKHCGHLIGYHGPEDEKCTVEGCQCSGYEPSDEETKSSPLPK